MPAPRIASHRIGHRHASLHRGCHGHCRSRFGEKRQGRARPGHAPSERKQPAALRDRPDAAGISASTRPRGDRAKPAQLTSRPRPRRRTPAKPLQPAGGCPKLRTQRGRFQRRAAPASPGRRTTDANGSAMCTWPQAATRTNPGVLPCEEDAAQPRVGHAAGTGHRGDCRRRCAWRPTRPRAPCRNCARSPARVRPGPASLPAASKLAAGLARRWPPQALTPIQPRR